MTSKDAAKKPTTLASMRQRVAENMRRLREEQGLTVGEAAYGAGLHERHWHKVEAGKTNTRLSTLARIAIALGVDVHALLVLSKRPKG